MTPQLRTNDTLHAADSLRRDSLSRTGGASDSSLSTDSLAADSVPAPKKEAPAPAPAPAAPAPEPVSADGVSPEVIAVIAAALASYGYGPAAIRAVRPIERDGWKNAGRSFGVQRTLE